MAGIAKGKERWGVGVLRPSPVRGTVFRYETRVVSPGPSSLAVAASGRPVLEGRRGEAGEGAGGRSNS